jgi:hypothetical protein
MLLLIYLLSFQLQVKYFAALRQSTPISLFGRSDRNFASQKRFIGTFVPSINAAPQNFSKTSFRLTLVLAPLSAADKRLLTIAVLLCFL